MIGSHKISNFDSSKIVLPEREASALLVSVCERLDAMKIGYCVERNYQGYPEVLTGDIDLIIGDSSMIFVSCQIVEVAEANGWFCYQHHIWDKTAFIGLCFDGLPNRFTLTIEIFSGARWHGIKFLDGEKVINHRLRHGITWRPSPCHQIIITTIHHLLYNRRVPEKYRSEIISLIEFDEGSVESNLAPYFGIRQARKITKELSKGNWKYFDYKTARRLKNVLLFRSLFISPLTTLTDVGKGLMSHFRGPEGISISIDVASDLAKQALIQSLLGIMTKWHIFKPPRREVIRPSFSTFKAKKLVAKILSSGGVALIDHVHANKLIDRSGLPGYQIVQARKLVILCQSSVILTCSEKLSYDGSNSDRVALEIINTLLFHRASLNKGFSH